jgi:hypothetical protein
MMVAAGPLFAVSHRQAMQLCNKADARINAPPRRTKRCCVRKIVRVSLKRRSGCRSNRKPHSSTSSGRPARVILHGRPHVRFWPGGTREGSKARALPWTRQGHSPWNQPRP